MNDKLKTGKKYKSHTFNCGLKWTGDHTWDITSAEADDIRGGPPPAFKGSEDRWSSEELLLASVNSCHLSTFIAYSKRKEFEVVSYESDISGLLEHDGEVFRYTKMTIRPRIVVKSEDDIETVKQYLKRAHDLCFMSHSVNAEVEVEPEIVVGNQ